MLLDITIRNFRSIKGPQTFSMIARSRIKEHEHNTFKEKDFKLLKTSIIYGANGSGKSNLILGLFTINYLLRKTSSYSIEQKIPYYPYLLEEGYDKQPTEFEINFIGKNQLRYKYFISYNKQEFLEEKLFYYPGKNPAKLFVRVKGKAPEFGSLLEDDIKIFINRLYPNQLLLSKVGHEKFDSLIPPYAFLTRHFSIHNIHDSRFDEQLLRVFTRVMEEEHKDLKDNILQLVKVADIGIKNFVIKKHDTTKFKFPTKMTLKEKEEIKKKYQYEIKTTHDLYKNNKKVGIKQFDLDMESTGTTKLLGVGSFILEALCDGDVIIIDELDKSLHPFLTKLIVQIFQSSKTNPFNSQLIFASHDVSLLNNELFRRDQIQFVEKNYQGDSSFYSLGDIQGVRKSLSYEKYYQKGTFGAIPLIDRFNLDFKFEDNEKK